MPDNVNRCRQCMHVIETGATVCPHCGYPAAKQQHVPQALPAGTLLQQRYQIGNLLKSNGEYFLYIAYDRELGVVVDIKEYFPDTLARRQQDNTVEPLAEKQEEFNRVGTEFANLHHILSRFRTMANIVQVYDLFDQFQTCYAVLEHVQGPTLREYLADNYGELEWENCASMFTNLIKAITHLHKSGVLHCGISPETLLVVNGSHLKLTSFCTLDARRRKDVLTAELYDGYAAPEQYTGSDCGPWTDVYSLAAVMYKTLTGTMPTASDTRGYNDNLIPPDVLNANVPKNVSLALMAALSLSPKLRTQTMDDLFADAVTPPRPAQKTMDIFVEEEEPDRHDEPESEDGPKTRKIVLISMIVSLCVVLFGVLVLLFLLFGDQWFS